MKTTRALGFLLIAAATAACSDDEGTGGGGQTATTTSPASTTSEATTADDASSSSAAESTSSGGPLTDFQVGGARPTTVRVPPGYSPDTPAPLLFLLHGYRIIGATQDAYFQMSQVALARGMLFVAPDGTVDAQNNHFWNATDACCDFFGTGVDDSAYLKGLIEEIDQIANVDRKRVFFVGHSNGGFMSYRMACDHAGDVAAIASLAGATFEDVASCAPASAVSVLQIHGTADDTILYDGGANGAFAYPSAETTVATWAGYDGCDAMPDTSAPPRDLEGLIAGDETTSTVYATGCDPGGHAELWTIAGGSHIPSLAADFSEQIVDFLEAHPKP